MEKDGGEEGAHEKVSATGLKAEGEQGGMGIIAQRA